MCGKRRMITLTVALFLTTAGFYLFDMLFRRLTFLEYLVRWEICITSRVIIDFYGVVIPTIFSLFAIFYLIYFRKFSLKKYLSYFLFSICLTCMFSIRSSVGIGFYHILLGLSIGFIVVFITFYDKGLLKFLKFRDLNRFNFKKRNYLTASLIAFSYASMSLLALDLTYALHNASLSITTYVGGMGTADAVILSGLYAFLGVTFASLCAMLIYEDAYPK